MQAPKRGVKVAAPAKKKQVIFITFLITWTSKITWLWSHYLFIILEIRRRLPIHCLRSVQSSSVLEGLYLQRRICIDSWSGLRLFAFKGKRGSLSRGWRSHQHWTSLPRHLIRTLVCYKIFSCFLLYIKSQILVWVNYDFSLVIFV